MADLFKTLLTLKAKGERVLSQPAYHEDAERFGDRCWWGNRNLQDRIWGSGYADYILQEHHLADIISWQPTVYIRGLLEVAILSPSDVQDLLVNHDSSVRVLVCGRLRLLVDGNHRYWVLRHYQTTGLFKTVYLDDWRLYANGGGLTGCYRMLSKEHLFIRYSR